MSPSADERRQQLAYLLQKKVSRPRDHPPSFAQERLWFLDQLRPGDTSYNLVSVVNMGGLIDVRVLRKSLDEVLRRHEILRTIFPTVDGGVVQRVLPEFRIEVPVVDLSLVPANKVEIEVRRQTRVQAGLPFNLASGPILRATILHFFTSDRLLLAVHHIAVDAWSFDILLREVNTLYAAFLMDQPSPLPELELQYADWARWQRDSLVDSKIDKELAYWMEELNGSPSVLELPGDHERPQVPTTQGGSYSFRLPRRLRDEILSLGHAEGTTLFMTLLAGLTALLFRWSGSSDIPIGTPMSSRTRAELEPLIGLFLNTVVLRLKIRSDDTFRNLLRRTRDTTFRAFAHQDLPFEKLVEALHPSRSPSLNPIFQVMLVVQSASDPDASPSDANKPIVTSVKFDLSFNIVAYENCLDVLIVWAADLFDEKTIVRLGTVWETLLTTACAAPDCRISELPLIEKEEARLHMDWSGECAVVSLNESALTFFTKQSQQNPENVAVKVGDCSCTYQELLSQSRRIGEALRTRAIGPELPVGLHMEDSSTMLAAMLGVWHAGGVVVLLPPQLSRNRMSQIINNSSPSIIVSEPSLISNLKGLSINGVLFDELLTNDCQSLDVLSDPLSLACVFYPPWTGGSKGLAMDHRGLLEIGLGTARELGLEKEDRVAVFSPFGWSESWDIVLAALLSGATILRLGGSDVYDFLKGLQNSRITVLGVPATIFPQLACGLSEIFETSSPPIKVLVVTGEGQQIDILREAYSYWHTIGFDTVRFVSYYGLCETAFPHMLFEGESKASGQWHQIGRPRSGFTARVLDSSGHQAPSGFPGELYLGGPAVGREIWKQPRETAACFRPHPLTSRSGARCLVIHKRARCSLDGVFEIELPGNTIQNPTIETSNILETDPQVESQIAAIWGDVLQVEGIGLHDNFFDLGGHSLSATRVISRVRKTFSVEIPLRVLFESPTVAELARYVRGLEKRSGSVLQRRSEKGDIPLSFAQERLWFLEQFLPSTGTYNIPVVKRWYKRLNPILLENVINEIIARHETLRTIFPDSEGRPIQRILPQLRIPLKTINLDQLPRLLALIETRRLSDEEANTPFDLASGPLLRAQLVQIAGDESVLLLTVHHIVADGWSFQILFKELETIYEALEQGLPTPLVSLELQYSDWVVWQRRELTGQKLEQLLRYWRTMLEDAPPLLKLPTDRPRSRHKASRGETCGFHIPKNLRPRLEAFSQAERSTLFMTLLTGFYALLKRWSGQADIVVGSPIANRTQHETEPLIGFFANTLALRARVEPNDTFRSLQQRVREVTLSGYAHQDLPFEKLVEELQPIRSLTNNPVFQVMFVFQNEEASREQLAGNANNEDNVRFASPPGGTSKFDLSAFIIDQQERLVIGFEFNVELFDKETIIRLGHRYSQLLTAAMDDPDERIDSLALISKEEEEKWLAQSRGPNSVGPFSVAKEVLEQASLTPHSVAVIDKVPITYSELVRRVQIIAFYIRESVDPGSKIGLCTERSADAVAATIAILLAGCTYVPLEPDLPSGLLRSIIDESQLSLILLGKSVPCKQFAGVKLLELDLLTSMPSDSQPWPDILHEMIAYVIYTSGSLGQRKGVVMTYGTLSNLISWQNHRSNLPPGARTLQFASLSFDVSIQEIFATLCAGGTLVVANKASRRDPELLLRIIHEQKIMRLFLPPVALRQLAANCKMLPQTLQEIIAAGEQLVLSPPIVELLDRCPHVKLYNQYGPSETHVVTEYCVDVQGPVLPPIGRPIPGVACYVLDTAFRPTGPDCPGELYLGGVCVALGYLDRPYLTADRFVPNPFSKGRLYRTGDLARFRSDGLLEFLGRNDDQIKVRGFRIEPGEIENVVEQHDAVRAAAVTTVGKGDGLRLVAFVVLREGATVTAVGLRSFVRARLPEHMVPASYTKLLSLPLTSTGKLDRRALLRLEVTQDTEKTYIKPRSPVERSLAAIWEELLGLSRIGIQDNFFDLGGHSLLATQMVSRARTVFQIEIPVSLIFEQPTLEELALAIVGEQAASCEEETVRLLADIEALPSDEVRRQRTQE
ncbi:non-ribosomal peptide synthetase [Candidatus Nitrospira neomarina]|uniref:Amino acid adenylation domain-containing protein n=1 Tax=Candidatus Nitrospira neomarina TaxID=3020899 RepID=A0AA96JX93_9BACT|nr:non-ribosomal peptide synthetase [Candidatus Nitrospira neomarina]WNM63148.1 amino acid adenylation domain-containing protein [Candidatus Nitrospira neomarina]